MSCNSHLFQNNVIYFEGCEVKSPPNQVSPSQRYTSSIFYFVLAGGQLRVFNYNTDFILYCFMGLGVLAVQDNRPSTSEILAPKHEIVSAASDLPSSRFRRKLIDTNEMEFIQVDKLFMK